MIDRGLAPDEQATVGPVWRWLPRLGGLLFLVLTIHAARVETPTVDEFAHVPAGMAYLVHGRFDLYSKNPPLFKALMSAPLLARSAVVVPEVDVPPLGWGPWLYGQRFMQANRERYLELFLPARLVVILCGLLAGVVIHSWSHELFGTRAAALCTALYFLSPTVLAHSHLATTDVGGMAGVVLVMYLLRRACSRPGIAHVLLVALAWGAALLVKFTAVLLLPVVVAVVAVCRWNDRKRALRDLLLIAVGALLVVNLGMGFQGSFRTLERYNLDSAFGRSLQRVLPGWTPVPLPREYVVGFDAQKRDTESGEFGSYLNGRWSEGGWWYYDLVALAVKTPLPFLPMLLGAARLLRSCRLPRDELLLLLAPPAVLVVAMTGFNRLNIGIRYLLPLFPFLFILLGALWTRWSGRGSQIAAAVVVAWYAAAALATAPAHLSFFNLAVGGPRNGHRLLLDSNLDWGQDLYRLRPALEQAGYEGKIGLLYFGHVDPALYGIEYELIPAGPVEGVLAVSVNYLMGAGYVVTAPDESLRVVPPGHLDWLRDHEPVARAGSIWIFDTRP